MLKAEKETKIGRALVSFARPHHKKANELFSRDPSDGCNNSVWSAGTPGRGHPALPGWLDNTDGQRTHTSRLNMNSRFVSG